MIYQNPLDSTWVAGEEDIERATGGEQIRLHPSARSRRAIDQTVRKSRKEAGLTSQKRFILRQEAYALLNEALAWEVREEIFKNPATWQDKKNHPELHKKLAAFPDFDAKEVELFIKGKTGEDLAELGGQCHRIAEDQAEAAERALHLAGEGSVAEKSRNSRALRQKLKEIHTTDRWVPLNAKDGHPVVDQEGNQILCRQKRAQWKNSWGSATADFAGNLFASATHEKLTDPAARTLLMMGDAVGGFLSLVRNWRGETDETLSGQALRDKDARYLDASQHFSRHGRNPAEEALNEMAAQRKAFAAPDVPPMSQDTPMRTPPGPNYSDSSLGAMVARKANSVRRQPSNLLKDRDNSLPDRKGSLLLR